MVAARICEINQDGSSNLVTFGIINFAQRKGREKNLKVTKNKFYEILINLNDTGYEFTKGNKIRLSLSTSYWPMAWPLPKNFRLKLKLDECLLKLPVNLLKKEAKNLVKFKKPVSAEFRRTIQVKKPLKRFRKIIEDKEKDESIFEIFCDKNEKIGVLSPTYAMYEVYSNLFKTKIVKVGYKNFKVDKQRLYQIIRNTVSAIFTWICLN